MYIKTLFSELKKKGSRFERVTFYEYCYMMYAHTLRKGREPRGIKKKHVP